MAEAVVEDRPQPQRFYCHLCSVEVQSVNSDYTCPLCSGGFIEELPAAIEPNALDVEMSEIESSMDDLDMIRDEIASLLMSRGNNRLPDQQQQDTGSEEDGQNSDGWRRVRNRNPRRFRMRNFGRFDNILLEILRTLHGGNEEALGNASMFFMGNPGDYAWGREGIDTIVTQLLNQMDTTGPPPLSKEKIDEIPNVDITEDQVEHKLQCSVCWEDFKLNESVRKLPCLHVYHENCIVPWLELHGTCPICRKSLTPEGSDGNNSLRNATATIHGRFGPDDQTAGGSNNGPTGRFGADQSGGGGGISNSESNPGATTNSTSSQEGMQQQHPDQVNIVNAIPLSLSRLFAQPGTSSQIPFLTFTENLGSLPFSQIHQQQQQHQQPQQHQHQQPSDGGGGGDGGTDSNRSNNSSNHPDVYRYDDGNVEFEFD